MNFGFYIVLFILSFLLTFAVRKFALKYSIMDIPNERSSHTVATPRGGGIAVVIVWFMGITIMFYHHSISKDLFYALLSGIPLVVVGFLDDITNLRPSIRFLVQLASSLLALYFLGGLQNFQFSIFNFQLLYLLTPFALFGIVWFINIFNFLDGIDGYIGTETIFICAAAFFLAFDLPGLLLAVLVLGFLFWNWPKAKIFMGDVGSTLLGFTIAVLAIYHQNNLTLSIPVWLILTSVFWFDATVTLFRRIRNKEKISQAHRKHAYQRVVQAGFSHQKTTLWALGLNIVGFGFAWMANIYKTYNWAFLAVDVLVLYVVMRWIDKKKPFERMERA